MDVAVSRGVQEFVPLLPLEHAANFDNKERVHHVLHRRVAYTTQDYLLFPHSQRSANEMGSTSCYSLSDRSD